MVDVDFGKASLHARMWLARHGQYVRRLGGLAQSLIATGPRGAAFGCALVAADAVAEMIAPDPYTVVRKWPRFQEYGMLEHVMRHALGPAPSSDGVEAGQIIKVASVLCVRSRLDMWADGDLQAVVAELRDRTWAALGPHLEAVTHTSGDSTGVDLRPAEATTRRTRQGAALVARLRPFVEAGGTSALLVGEPGCGKTTAAAEAVADLGASRALRVSVAELERIGESSLRALVRFLRPEVFLIDDVDRHDDPAELLALFDDAGQHARLRIATCNYPRRLGSALLRPGRFDLHVRSEDPEVAWARLADAHDVLSPVAARLPPDVLGEVEAWPIAFAANLASRLRVVGVDAWEREVVELRRRLAEQRAMDEAEVTSPQRSRLVVHTTTPAAFPTA